MRKKLKKQALNIDAAKKQILKAKLKRKQRKRLYPFGFEYKTTKI